MATTNYSWVLPTVGGSEDTWGTENNTVLTAIDTLLGGTDATEFAILNGATVTTAELNILDGVTATAAELNALDGITATVTELNYVDGVTSAIQTQLDAKQASDATLTALAGTLTAANKIPYATALDTAGELDFKDEDDLSSDSASALASQQSVKAYVDTQVAAVASMSLLATVATTSGTSAAATSLTLSGYTMLKMVVDSVGCSGSSGVSLRCKFGAGTYNSISKDTNFSTDALYGLAEVHVSTGVCSWNVGDDNQGTLTGASSSDGTGNVGNGWANYGDVSSETSISFDMEGETFDEGQILIYGVK